MPAPDSPPALSAGLGGADLHGGAEQLVRATTGFSQLAFRGGAEITQLVADVHAAIAGGLPIVRGLVPDAVRSPLPYRIVHTVFSLLEAAAAALPRGGDSRPSPDHWQRFVSVLNGVAGDRLAEWGNALAIEMTVRDGAGDTFGADRWRAAARSGAVLFVHGLCCSDVEWHTPAHDALAAELEAAGYAVGWLRYNSGRSIAESGAELAELLETALGGATAPRLILIGHSMGGLVIRSACHTAAARRYGWLARLTDAAYLGSPHHGAPLERAGNLANALLGITAYSAPFMRIGNVRSRGIKDLRFGCVTAEQSAAAAPCFRDARGAIVALPGHVRHLLVAASLPAPVGDTWIGDGLVPVDSALGQHAEAVLCLQGTELTRLHFTPLNHLALMTDPRTCEALREWLLARADLPAGDLEFPAPPT